MRMYLPILYIICSFCPVHVCVMYVYAQILYNMLFLFEFFIISLILKQVWLWICQSLGLVCHNLPQEHWLKLMPEKLYILNSKNSHHRKLSEGNISAFVATNSGDYEKLFLIMIKKIGYTAISMLPSLGSWNIRAQAFISQTNLLHIYIQKVNKINDTT